MSAPSHDVRFAVDANADVAELAIWGVKHFGERIAERYKELIKQALYDLSEDPFRPGTRERRDLEAGLHSYHLANSRKRVVGEAVKKPRHSIFYRVVEQRVFVSRILHDATNLATHFPSE